ncbi:MAG: hypothetical protein RKP20_17710 [Candidatus Competibacter sp.]|nr:hypothetical protein [Candidatus Competibacter sp.]
MAEQHQRRHRQRLVEQAHQSGQDGAGTGNAGGQFGGEHQVALHARAVDGSARIEKLSLHRLTQRRLHLGVRELKQEMQAGQARAELLLFAR